MSTLKITYVIHVAATPERLWETLTNRQARERNWGRIQSAWFEGSPVQEISRTGKVLWQGEVLRSDPPRLLSFTFGVSGVDEPSTEVTFELGPPVSRVAPGAKVVRLAVTQTGFIVGSKLSAECARAWTEILSSFKSDVETGSPLPFAWEQ
ncbi:MAG: SRPBCC domain-containing protein [Acidobacteriia bacterium]|nr:SRPBCC domain-containing protein [Terriglobia bacterium]